MFSHLLTVHPSLYLLMSADLCLHECPSLLLLLESGHVQVVLFGFGERYEESVKDPEELIRLQVGCVLSKVSQCLSKLQEETKRGVTLQRVFVIPQPS